MPYIRLSDNFYPLYDGDIRLAHPDMGAEFVLPNGYAEVVTTSFPQYNSVTQTCVRQTPVFENGAWVEVWMVKDLTPQELAIKYADISRAKNYARVNNHEQ